MVIDLERFKDKGGYYEYLINHWHYSPGLVAAGFLHSSFFGLAATYSAYHCRYSADYLAAAKSI
jgi:hypothetical protein